MIVVSTIILVLISAALYLKGKARFAAFGFNWKGRYPRFYFGSGRGWAIAARNDKLAINEMTEKVVDLYTTYNDIAGGSKE